MFPRCAITTSFVHRRIDSNFSPVDSTIRLPEKPEYGDPALGVVSNLISHAVTLDMPTLAVGNADRLQFDALRQVLSIGQPGATLTG